MLTQFAQERPPRRGICIRVVLRLVLFSARGMTTASPFTSARGAINSPFVAILLILLWVSCGSIALAEGSAPPLNLELLEDVEGQWTIDHVQAPPLSQQFRPSPTNTPVFGFRDSVYWVRFTLRDEGFQPLILELGHPSMDEVDLYRPDGSGGFTLSRTGPEGRRIQAGSIVFKLLGASDKPRSYYMRIKSVGTLQIPLRLWTTAGFADHSEYRSFWRGTYLGLLVALFGAAIALYFLAREPNTLLFALFIACAGAYQFVVMGYTHYLFWPEHLAYPRIIRVVFANLGILSLLLFSDRLLGLSRHAPRAHRWLMVLAGTLVALLFLAPFDPAALGLRVVRSLSVITLLVLIPLALFDWRRGHLTALFCLLGLTALLVGGLVDSFVMEGWIPYNDFTSRALLIGIVLEMILLSVAFAVRVNNLKEERVAAETEAKNTMLKLNKGLERAVAERTTELEQAKSGLERLNSDLEEKNRRLSKAAMFDGLTGLLNYQTFMNQFATKLAEAERYQHWLVLIMIDLDHFKQINDNYGHQIGNFVLSEVAASLTKHSRDSDVVARYGGEELAVLFPVYAGHNPEDMATGFSERVRTGLKSIRIESAPELRITASFGVVWSGKGEKIDPHTLISHADAALYGAKGAGRDRVQIFRE